MQASELKTDAVMERKHILRDNPNLARRALFGVQMRTEILEFSLKKGFQFSWGNRQAAWI